MRRLTFFDLIRTAGLGVTGRPVRTALSALGVALGIASLVALTSVAASNQAQLLAELDALGADLAVVRPAPGPDGRPIPMPPEAPQMIARHDGVAQIGALEATPPNLAVFRNEHIPSTQTGGITVAVAQPNVLAAVDAQLAHGRWFDDASRALPTTVLGATAAARLGITEAGDRVMIGDTWYAVIGILADSGLAGGALDTSAIIGDLWVQYHFADTFPEAGEISDIFVRAESGQLDQVANLLAEAASPGFPHQVQVGRMVDVAAARAAVDNALNTLGLALGGIALLVGGVGIMNTMVVTVMERRGEIGLRRALGARPGQVATQFTTEAVALSALGGTLGLALGAAAAIVIATVSNQPVVIPATTAFLGLGLSVVVGALAGMQPAIRAARVAPVTALRAV